MKIKVFLAPPFADSVFKRSGLEGFSINELKPYIKRGGLLSRIAG
ncbi:MAG: hypothetical protein ABIV48_01085 [Pyrinomonadaceae bacterium]